MVSVQGLGLPAQITGAQGQTDADDIFIVLAYTRTCIISDAPKTHAHPSTGLLTNTYL
jgi:hypothetical protein